MINDLKRKGYDIKTIKIWRYGIGYITSGKVNDNASQFKIFKGAELLWPVVHLIAEQESFEI